MNAQKALLGCGVLPVMAVIWATWLIALISSLLFRPKRGEEDEGMRGVDRLLVVTSVLVILSLGALYFMIRASKG